MKRIIQNQVHCNRCGGEPYSANLHDFKYCQCGAIAVDGGLDYLRRVGELNGYYDMSISMEEDDIKFLVKEIDEQLDDDASCLSIGMVVLRELKGLGYISEFNQDTTIKIGIVITQAMDRNCNSFGILLSIIRELREQGALVMSKFND